MECRLDCKIGFIKLGEVNVLKTLPFYVEKEKINKNTRKKEEAESKKGYLCH